MIKKIGAAAMAAMLFMGIFTGCKKEEPKKKSDEPVRTFQTLKTSDGEKVFEDLEPLSYKTVVEGTDYNKFVFDFAGRSCTDKDENVMVSPASLLFAMEMVGAGANGNTLTEMSNVLVPGASNEEALAFASDYYKSIASDGKVIKAANGVLIREDIGGTYYEDYLDYIKENFDAEIRVEPFSQETVNEVNDWVNDHTDGMIPKIISDLSPDTAMILMDAIAFDAKWEEQYEDYNIIEDYTFNTSLGEKEDVTMLHSTEGIYFETDKATGFMKYYDGEDYAFVAVLPKDESITANEFLSGFTSEDYKAFLDSRVDDSVEAYIPEFSYDYSNDTIAVMLQEMGIHDAFELGKADFSNMSTDPQYISTVIQKTHIELTSEGTKAAAATVVTTEDACEIEPDHPNLVILNRPFAYMIVDTETNTPVFVGSVNSVN